MFNIGYLIKITSWENDGDNYRDAILDGLGEDEAYLYVDIAELLKHHPYGNIYDPSNDERRVILEALAEIILKYKDTSWFIENFRHYKDCTKEEFAKHCNNEIGDILHKLELNNYYTEQFTRETETIELYNIKSISYDQIR